MEKGEGGFSKKNNTNLNRDDTHHYIFHLIIESNQIKHSYSFYEHQGNYSTKCCDVARLSPTTTPICCVMVGDILHNECNELQGGYVLYG